MSIITFEYRYLLENKYFNIKLELVTESVHRKIIISKLKDNDLENKKTCCNNIHRIRALKREENNSFSLAIKRLGQKFPEFPTPSQSNFCLPC